MLKKIIVALFILYIIPMVAMAENTNYDVEIKKLQNQLNELSRKIEGTKIDDKIKLLDGLVFGARLHIAANYYDKDEELKSYNTGSSYNNDFSVKRARITIRKKMDDFLFNFEVNYNKDKISLGENFIGYELNDEMAIKFGQILTPSFMEREQSSNTKVTIDSSAFVKENWIADYLIGLNYVWITNKFGISTGVFGNGTNNQGELENNTDMGYSFRGYYTPLRDNKYTLHLGFDLSYRNYKKDNINNPDQIKNKFYYGLEFAFQYKFAIFTTEFIKLYYKYEDSRFDGNRFDFDGLYSELSVNFTGEKASYNSAGYFGNINVKNPLSKGGFGAFQGVLRYSFADGKDYSGGFLNNIGSLHEYTLGLNWIPENYFRLLLGYSKNRVVKKNYVFRGEYDAFKIEARMYF